jgi:DNA polymerase III sliding clamp (beta) subunit (PCNA family)
LHADRSRVRETARPTAKCPFKRRLPIHLTVKRDELFKALKILRAAVAHGSASVPAGVRMGYLEMPSLVLTATDGDLTIQTMLAPAGDSEPGTVTVDYEPLAAFVKLGQHTNALVRIHLAAGKLRIATGPRTLTLPLIDELAGPELRLTAPFAEDARLIDDARLLGRWDRQVAPARAKTSRRPALEGIHLDFRDNIVAACATDKYRMHLLRTPTRVTRATDFVLPVRALKAGLDIARLERATVLSMWAPTCSSLIGFETTNTRLVVDKLTGRIPDWRTLLPCLDNYPTRLAIIDPDCVFEILNGAAGQSERGASLTMAWQDDKRTLVVLLMDHASGIELSSELHGPDCAGPSRRRGCPERIGGCAARRRRSC